MRITNGAGYFPIKSGARIFLRLRAAPRLHKGVIDMQVFSPITFSPVRFRASALLLAALLLPFGGIGCGGPKRVATESENATFVRHKIEQAELFLARRPPLADKAREAAMDALLIDPDSIEARMLLSDAWYLGRGSDTYDKALKALKPLEEQGVEKLEVSYRKARAHYWLRSRRHHDNYAKAREAALDCLDQGDKYLVECYTIIRNSYIGEAEGNPAALPGAYTRAAESAENLYRILDADDPAKADTALVLAEYYQLFLNRPRDAERYLAVAQEAATTRPALQERVDSFIREQELRRFLAGGSR